MARYAFLAGIVGAASLLALVAPAAAASSDTAAFVANVRPNVSFLDDSSRLALDTSRNPVVRSFAHREAMEQTIVGNSLVAWTQTNTARAKTLRSAARLPERSSRRPAKSLRYR